MSAFHADKAPCVLRDRAFIKRRCPVLLLRQHQQAKRADCHVFVLTDSPEHNFVAAGPGIEMPSTVLRYERNGKGPVFRTYAQNGGFVRLKYHTVHLLIFLDESVAFELVLDVVA